MKPEELKVGMWTTGGWQVARLITRIEDGVVYCQEFQWKDVEDESYTSEAYVTLGERLATAAEVRQHVPESEWPQWVKDDGPNPHAKPAADEDGLVWWTPGNDRYVLTTSPVAHISTAVITYHNGGTPHESPWTRERHACAACARPDWLTPAQLAEIKRLLGVEAKPLPWDKTEELRTVDGRKVHGIKRALTSGYTFDLGDNNPGPCICDEFGRLRGTDIPIIRLATAAELEAEKPKPPKPSLHIDLSHYAAKCVAVHFPGMKFDRTEGDDTAVFVRVEGGGE